MTDDVLDDEQDSAMDERLALAGRRWQAEQAPSPGVPIDRLDAPLPRRRVAWRPLVAAAAAVLLVGGGASVISRFGDSATTPSPTSPGVPSGPRTVIVHGEGGVAVPWKPLKAGHPHVRHRVQGQVVTPFDQILTSGRISGRVHPGDLLVFTAVLESPTDLTLDPCPDYDLGFGSFAFYQWRLNCAQVPFRDAQGHPMLPANRKVRFEMRIRVPDDVGRQKVLWTIDGPQTAPGFYGLVDVIAP
jgi:hypothetical protein